MFSNSVDYIISLIKQEFVTLSYFADDCNSKKMRRSSAKHKAAGKKAARTRARNKARRGTAARKAARTRRTNRIASHKRSPL